MKFKKGDSIVLVENMLGTYDKGERGIIEKVHDGDYWVKLDNSGWFRVYTELGEKRMEHEEVFDSPLYKALS